MVVFFTNGTLSFDIVLGGVYLETIAGTYVNTGRSYVFTVVDSDNWTWTGKLNFKTDQFTGTFRSSLGSYRGRWQATLKDNGEE